MENHILPYEVVRFTHQQRHPEIFVETNLHRLNSQGQSTAIVTHIEINNPWHPTAQIAGKITNKILSELNQAENLSALNRFERTLQAVNGLIQESTEKLETSIAVAVIFLKGDAIYFSAAGPARLLLHRQKKIVDLHKINKQSTTTFAEVTSGDLSPTDWLIVGNDSFASIVCNCPNTYWGESPGEQVISDIKTSAKNTNINSTSGVILRLSTNPQIKTVLWEESSAGGVNENTTILTERFATISALPKIISDNLRLAAKNISQVLLKVTKAVRLKKFPRLKAPKIAQPKLKVNLKPKFVIFIIFLLAVVIGGFYYQQLHSKAEKTQKTESFLEQLQHQDSANYLNYLASSFDYPGYQDLSDTEKSTVLATLKTAGIELITPQLVAELPHNVKYLTTSTDYKLAIDDEGQVWQLLSPVKKLEQSSLLTSPVSVIAISADTGLVSDETGNIWLISASPTSPLALSLPSAMATGPKKIEKFSNNLYFYVAATKTIYRLSGFTNEITTPTKVVVLENDLGDWTINGDIVIGDTLGTINSYKKGKKTTLKITLPILAQPKITSSQLNNLLAATSGRYVFLYSNEGILQRTIFLPFASPIDDLDFDALGALWLTSDKKVYQLKL